MKKTILTVLIGLIVGIAGTVIASNYLASEIVYNDTTVEDALNELYTVHETYKNLTTDTTVASDKLLDGITAYNKNGELITGSLNVNNGFKGILNVPSDYTGSTYEYNLGFRPTFIYFEWSNGYYWTYINDHTYANLITRDGYFQQVTNDLTITDTGFNLNLNYNPGLKGLSANIYAYK